MVTPPQWTPFEFFYPGVNNWPPSHLAFLCTYAPCGGIRPKFLASQIGSKSSMYFLPKYDFSQSLSDGYPFFGSSIPCFFLAINCHFQATAQKTWTLPRTPSINIFILVIKNHDQRCSVCCVFFRECWTSFKERRAWIRVALLEYYRSNPVQLFSCTRSGDFFVLQFQFRITGK